MLTPAAICIAASNGRLQYCRRGWVGNLSVLLAPVWGHAASRRQQRTTPAAAATGHGDWGQGMVGGIAGILRDDLVCPVAVAVAWCHVSCCVRSQNYLALRVSCQGCDTSTTCVRVGAVQAAGGMGCVVGPCRGIYRGEQSDETGTDSSCGHERRMCECESKQRPYGL